MTADSELSVSTPLKLNFSFAMDDASLFDEMVLRIDRYLLSSCWRLCFWLGVLVRVPCSTLAAPDKQEFPSIPSLNCARL